MLNLMIHSPGGIPNKEKYLSKELAMYRNRRIVQVEKLKSGSIEISFGREIVGTKYFVKVYKKNEFANLTDFLTEYIRILDSTKCTRFPEVIQELEYGSFSVVFFKTVKRKSRNKKK